MKYINVQNIKNLKILNEAADIIKSGGILLMPTETVYGIGANGLDKTAVKKIFIAKGRSQDNPLILHISDMQMLHTIACDISKLEYKLMEKFWPGPLTIILKRTNIVPDIVTGGLDTVGIRMPKNKIANKIISLANTPIAAPSANISGKPSGTNIKDIMEELKDNVDYIVDNGDCDIGLESTVIQVLKDEIVILRPGKITKEDLLTVCNNVTIDKHIFSKTKNVEKVLSPGMKYKHYAPNSKCILVYSNNNEKMVEKIISIASNYTNPLIISTTENIKKYKIKNVLDIGSANDFKQISKNLFSYLRKVDNYNPDIAIIEGVKKEGIGLAIMNRLIRACEYNFIEV